MQQRVLVVEDDDDLRCLLERELSELGLSVTAVPTAERAIALLNDGAERWDVTITDIKMPGMDGVELTRWIKQCRPEVEVILLTGHASLDSAMAAVRLGASDYLTKPLQNIGELYGSLRAAMGKQQQAQVVSGGAGRAAPPVGMPITGLLDHLPLGVVLLDRRGQVQQANGKAQAILDAGDGLQVGRDGRLYAASWSETRQLRQLQESSPTTRRSVGAMVVRRPSGELPLSLLVATCAVAPAADHESEPASVATAVFIGDPSQRGPSVEWVLRELHGLTPAEARLTGALLERHSIDAAAAVLGISRNTACTHLKRVFAKTGTSRQGDLISLLLYSPALLHVEEPDCGERG